MSKLWIDLTDIQDWQGQHGGVQRVVYGIASNYYLYGTGSDMELGFFIFNPKNHSFHEADFEPIYQRVEWARKSVLVEHIAPLSAEARLKLKYKKYIPSRILEHEPTRRFAKKAGKKAINAIRLGKEALGAPSIKSSANTDGSQLKFSNDDTVLILGKPWDDLNIQKNLSKMKQETGFKLVQVVYDLIIPLYPQLHHRSLFKQYTQHMFEVVASSDLLLPISKSTEADLDIFSKRLGLNTPKTKVIRLGDDIAGKEVNTSSQSPDNRVSNNFILCVGTIEIRKNHTLLYYAYKLAEEREIDLPQLVVVGGSGWLTHDIQYLIKTDPSIRKKIILLNNVSDAGLDWLYRNCKFTVYPSMYEGWGLPIAESLAYGKVCLSSNASSMVEIAEELVEYFSPYDVDACLKKIADYNNGELRQKREVLIRKKYKVASWGDTYKQVDLFIQMLN